MKFGNLNYLFLLWLIPLLIGFYIYAFKAKDKAVKTFCGLNKSCGLMPNVSRGRQKAKAALLILSVFFMIIALIRPKWGFTWEDIKRRGVDIIIALDVSRSMQAKDVSPSRLMRAKREITDLLNILEGDRIGLVAFAGAAFVQCPLTLDYGAAAMFLDYLDTDLIPVQGTALGQAIRTCIGAFGAKERKSKAIILITDGEAHEGEALSAANEAKEEGIKIFAIGIGKKEGAPIPLADGAGGFKKNAGGELIISKLDETTLQKIALTTGGAYVRSITGNLDLEEIYQKGIKEHIKEKELKSTRRKRWHERFQWFCILAFIMLAGEFFIPEKNGKAGT